MLTKGNIYKCTRDNVLKKPPLKPRIVEVKKNWTVKENFETNIVFFILILQLCWFSNQGDQLVKNENFFSCTQSKSDTQSKSATINHSETLNRGHSWTYNRLLGTLAMTSQFLLLKKIMSTILHHTSFFTVLHHTSFFTAKFEFFPRIY